jgi:VWFA-related protein
MKCCASVLFPLACVCALALDVSSLPQPLANESEHGTIDVGTRAAGGSRLNQPESAQTNSKGVVKPCPPVTAAPKDNLIIFPVTVIDLNIRLITNLPVSSFEVLEDGSKQDIACFSSYDAPSSVGILLDDSESMSSKLSHSVEAVRQFIHNSNPANEYFLIACAQEPRLVFDFTDHRNSAEQALANMQTKGSPLLFDAIAMALKNFEKAQHSKRALLVLTDAQEDYSQLYSETKIEEQLKHSAVQLYTAIVFEYGREHAVEKGRLPQRRWYQRTYDSLASLAELTGGRTISVHKINIAQMTGLLGAELRTQYVLGFESKDTGGKSRWHKINVRAKAPNTTAKLNALARKGYYSAVRK